MKRKFVIVLAAAQRILRRTFGMELVELMSRTELEKGVDGAEVENAATGVRKKGLPTVFVLDL